MTEMHDLLYRLKLADQASTQLFEKQLGISLTRYQMELTELARDRLLVHPPAHHLQVKAQMDQILSEKEQDQLSHLLEKLVSGLEQITF